MRKPIFIIASAIAAAFAVASCSSDNNGYDPDAYNDWKAENEAWLKTMATKTNADGSPMYTKFTPGWDPSVYVLIRHIGEVNTGNLAPLYTSTTKVNYQLHLMNDTLIDKGTGFVSTLNSQGLIQGWALGQLNMHVGDSCEIIMPQEVAYGQSGSSSVYPYSALRFNIKLVDIVNYETKL